MSLQDRLLVEMNQAAKAGDRLKLSTIRLIRSAVKNKEIEKKKSLEDEEVLKVISSMIRQMGESIEQFQKGGRDDLVKKEEAELKILQSYMPEQLSEEQIEKLINEALEETGAISFKDMGKVMKALMPKIAGRADGAQVNRIVREKLSNPSTNSEQV
ncbi:MAG: GatB/YqeY domain-containing protein [Deltaproteobacteria bacterium]|nr:MAG: GatB/YqeY domain-containing protein [Deltaproteobacteria bacterium]